MLRHEHLRPRELDRLLAEERKQRLVSLLILRAEIEIDDATLALSEQTGYPGALERHLEQRDASLARGFPQALMRNFCVVPLVRTSAGALVVVARDPSPALAEAVRGELGMPIELAVAPAIFLERLITRLAGGAPSAVPPELPYVERVGSPRHRKSVSSIMNLPLELPAEPAMPTVDLPEVTNAQLIQPGKPTLTLDLDEETPPPEPPRRPARPTRPIPGTELEPLVTQAAAPSLDDIINSPDPEDALPPVSTRPTRPSVTVPTVTEPSAPHRATPNIIKRPPTPLPVAPSPVIARTITEEPPERDPAEAQVRPTYPKLEPPPPSVFDADTARPQKPIKSPSPPASSATPPTPPPRPPTAPEQPLPRARTTTDNWDDFEDSKVGMGVPPPEVLDQMSSIGITPPIDTSPSAPTPLRDNHVSDQSEPQPAEPVEPPKRQKTQPPPIPVRATQPLPTATGTGALPSLPRPGTSPGSTRPGTSPGSTRPGTSPGSTRPGTSPGGEPIARPGGLPRAKTGPVVIPPIPGAAPRPGTPPPIPAGNVFKEIEKALSRATADRLLMKHVATKWKALLLVLIHGDRAKGSRGHGPRLQAGVESIDVEVASSAILLAAVDPSAAAPDGKDPIAELLGSPTSPRVEPVIVDEQVVAVLAAGDTLDGATADELPLLAGALAVAYQRFPK